MKLTHYAAACALSTVIGAGLAFAQNETMPADQPQTIGGIETVCTGSDSESRSNPAWKEYSLRLEFVGKDGQYLGDETVSVQGNGVDVQVHCRGPWVLMKLPSGSYKISSDVAEAGHKDITMRAPGRMVVRFPQAGGEVTGTPRPQVAAQ